MGDQNNQQGQQNAANNNQQGQAPGLAQNLGVPPALQPGQQQNQAGMGIVPPLPHQPGFIGPLPPPNLHTPLMKQNAARVVSLQKHLNHNSRWSIQVLVYTYCVICAHLTMTRLWHVMCAYTQQVAALLQSRRAMLLSPHLPLTVPQRSCLSERHCTCLMRLVTL